MLKELRLGLGRWGESPGRRPFGQLPRPPTPTRGNAGETEARKNPAFHAVSIPCSATVSAGLWPQLPHGLCGRAVPSSRRKLCFVLLHLAWVTWSNVSLLRVSSFPICKMDGGETWSLHSGSISKRFSALGCTSRSSAAPQGTGETPGNLPKPGGLPERACGERSRQR